MGKRILEVVLLVSCIAISSSCREDPELVKQHLKQAAEISKLKDQTASMQAEVDQVPEDKSEELKSAKKQNEQSKSEAQALKKGIEDTRISKATVQKEMDAYRQKYKIK